MSHVRTLATLVSCAQNLQHSDLAADSIWVLEVVKCCARQQSTHSGSDRNLHACGNSRSPLLRSNWALKLSEQPQ